jgi:hypothetical protein
MYVELWTAQWGTKLGSSLSSKVTIAPTGTLGIDNVIIDKEFVFYPNPVSNVLNFNNNGIEISSVKITNILGQTVYSDSYAVGKNSIDVSKLSSGIYILSVNSSDNEKQIKFQKK